MKENAGIAVAAALMLAFAGGIYWLISKDDAAQAAGEEYHAALAIGDEARACAAAGEAAFQWQLIGNEDKAGEWRLNKELACFRMTIP